MDNRSVLRPIGLLLSSFLTLLFLLWAPQAYANEASDAFVAAGRVILFDNINSDNPTYSGIIAANDEFKAAVIADPSDPEANLFYAFTRIIAFALEQGSSEDLETLMDLFEAFGMPRNENDLIDDLPFEDPPEMYDYIVLPETAPNGEDIRAFLAGPFVVVLNEAIGNLNVIPVNFTINLTTDETGDQAIEVDYGDVLIFKAAFYTLNALLKIITAYDLDVDIREITVFGNAGVLQIQRDLLDRYPDLLKLRSTDGAASLTSARQALLNGIDAYRDAFNFITNESDDQGNDLLFFESAEDVNDASELLTELNEIKASLTNDNALAIEGSFTIDLNRIVGNANKSPLDIRAILPEFDQYGEPIADTFPGSPVLNGIFPDIQTNDDLTAELDLQPSDPSSISQVSGTITCSTHNGTGNIFIWAFDGPNPGTAHKLGNTHISSPGSYSITGLPIGVGVYLFARWDADDNGARTLGDYWGMSGPQTVLSGGTTGVDFDVNTEFNIDSAINNGLQWLSANQNQDGSWGMQYAVAKTALAVLCLEKYALDKGFSSPFDTNYQYHTHVEKGFNYIFANAYTTTIGTQPAGDPDGDSDGIGVHFYEPGDDHHTNYYTSMAMMALAFSNAPGRVVDVQDSPVNTWTYGQVAQDVLDYLAYGQTDSGFGRGGWGYGATDNSGDWSDQSNSGWVTLALAYAEADPSEGFGLSIPGFVRTELNSWINYIQDDVDGDTHDGGSHYGDINDPEMGSNMLRTGNLLQQMAFVGDTSTTQRVTDAVDYIVRHWEEAFGWSPFDLQTSYTTMKGLEALGITTIGTSGLDWYQDLTDGIIYQQYFNGSWPKNWWDYSDNILPTEWALLTLQKAIAPTEENPDLEIVNKVETWVDKEAGTYTVSYAVKNKGNIEVALGHDVGLTVDDNLMEQKEVLVALAPGGTSNTFTFGTELTLSGVTDVIRVCADINGEVEELNEDNNCVTNIWPPIIIGDLNGDEEVDLNDAVLALKVLVGLNPDGIDLRGDVDGDGKIGNAEIIYILQIVGGQR